jgi:hypothetical protein
MKKGSDWKQLDFRGIKTYSLKERISKVEKSFFASPLPPGSTFTEFLNSLPQYLAAKDLKEVVSRIISAVRGDKMILLGMGAHPIKVGLNPIIIDLMERNVIRGVAMNGAGIIHDVEIALVGKTSEEVEEGLNRGLFGLAKETAEFINAALKDGHKKGWGVGRTIGSAIQKEELPHRGMSICAAAFTLDLPLTVHIAVGTDVVHIHPSTDGAILGELTYRDFRLFSSMVASLEGGVYINLGSAVIMPEVFLKALSAVRNLGYRVEDFVTLNLDFIQHYRPLQNVVRRPTSKGGKGFALTGHHEIMFPMLAGAIIDGLEGEV